MTEQLAVKQTLCKHSTGQEIEIWQKLPVCCFQIMIYSSIPPPSLAHRWTNSLSLLEFLYSFPLEFYHPHTHTHTHTHTSIYLSIYYLYMNVRGSFLICSSQNLETTQTSISRWTGKQIFVHLYHRILLNNKKKWTTDTHIEKKIDISFFF